MELYREIDIQAITDKLDQIIDEANDIKKKTLEPTLDECFQVQEVICDFIRKKKRIIYGGTAYNELIKNKNKKDGIYSIKDCKDIEFYTPKPIEDIMELSNILDGKKFKYVQGRQANHAETYTIFVNFEQICDMSYMPSNIFSNMPVITINGLLYSHPLWILVDILRQYNDPITSYWRLKDKKFFRANILLKYYPLELEKNKYKLNKDMIDIKTNIFNEISKLNTLIFIGSIAEEYYLSRSSEINKYKLECFSVNFENDIKIINKFIEKILSEKYKNIKINLYKPFYQFTDQHIEFILNNVCLLKIYGSNNKCIPYNILHLNNSKIEKIQLGGFYKRYNQSGGSETIKIGSFMILFNHLLIERQYYYINRSDKYKEIESRMYELLKERQDYLKNKSKTVIDNSPFKEFILKCSGDTIDQAREFRLNILKKKQKGQRTIFTYDPATQKNAKIPEYIFTNTSGNLDSSGLQKIFN